MDCRPVLFLEGCVAVLMLSALSALSLPLSHWPPPLPSPRPACSRAQPQLLPPRLPMGRGLPPAAGQVWAGGGTGKLRQSVVRKVRSGPPLFAEHMQTWLRTRLHPTCAGAGTRPSAARCWATGLT